jgi:hypothetical protein
LFGFVEVVNGDGLWLMLDAKSECKRQRGCSLARTTHCSPKMNLAKQVDPQSTEGCSPFKIGAVQHAIKNGILHEDQPLALMYNLSRFRYET